MDSVEEFRRYRERLNNRIVSGGNLRIKQFFALDSRAFERGVLEVKRARVAMIASPIMLFDVLKKVLLIRSFLRRLT